MPTRIISGGQTGADQGALFAAETLNIPTGGYIPKGFRTDTGPSPKLATRFGLLEHTSAAYADRTIANVMASDATLIIGRDTSPGCKLTRHAALTYQHIPLYYAAYPSRLRPDNFFGDLAFIDWLKRYNIRTLNVAGNRERTNIGIFTFTQNYLIANLI